MYSIRANNDFQFEHYPQSCNYMATLPNILDLSQQQMSYVVISQTQKLFYYIFRVFISDNLSSKMQIGAKLCANTAITLSTGNKIPMIGYGTYKITGPQGIQATKAAIQLGYTHLDTASFYANEIQLRKVIQQLGISRQKLYITSKIFTNEQGYKQSREAVEKIINKLNCQYLDLILIHWPGSQKYNGQDPKNQELRLQTWRTFIELQKENKVKDIGVSNFLKHHLEHLLKNSSVAPTVNQFQIHPLLWQGPTIDFCREKNIAIQAYSPLARQHEKLFKNQVMLELQKKYKKSVAQLSLRWCLQHGFIILPKSQTQSRIKENIDLFDFEITKKDMQKINELKNSNVRICWDPNTIKY